METSTSGNHMQKKVQIVQVVENTTAPVSLSSKLIEMFVKYFCSFNHIFDNKNENPPG